MRHFITPEGIVPVEITDEELFKRLCGENYMKSNGALEQFKYLLSKYYIIFKAFDYPFNDLFKWAYSDKSASNSPHLFNLSQHLELTDKINRYSIVCFIDSRTHCYYTHTLYVEKHKVEAMIRNAHIDEYLIENP